MSTRSVAPLELNDLFEYMEIEWVEKADWIGVAHVNMGESYSWDEFAVWYSPSARRYFWISGSGCSCNSLSDYTKLSDFTAGTLADALAAANRYLDDLIEDQFLERGLVLGVSAALTQRINSFSRMQRIASR